MNDGIPEDHRAGIIAALRTNPRITRAVLFGSRAMGTHLPASDIDLALEGDQLDIADLLALQGRFVALDLPVEVDTVIRATISNPDLEKHIMTHGVVWYVRDDA